jgi:hypothetical protein
VIESYVRQEPSGLYVTPALGDASREALVTAGGLPPIRRAALAAWVFVNVRRGH